MVCFTIMFVSLLSFVILVLLIYYNVHVIILLSWLLVILLDFNNNNNNNNNNNVCEPMETFDFGKEILAQSYWFKQQIDRDTPSTKQPRLSSAFFRFSCSFSFSNSLCLRFPLWNTILGLQKMHRQYIATNDYIWISEVCINNKIEITWITAWWQIQGGQPAIWMVRY